MKDKLGRIPSDLQPEGFGGGFDIDVEMRPPVDEQITLGGRFSALALEEDNDSEHGQSVSENDAPGAKEPAAIAVDSPADGDEGGGESGGYQIVPGSKEPVIECFPRILPSPPSDISNNDMSRILPEAALKPVHTSTHPIIPACDSDGGSRRSTMMKWVRMTFLMYEGLTIFSSNVESLKKGIINTSKNRALYTILLTGETGVGKSSFVELLANVLAGNDIDHYTLEHLDPTNEEGGSSNRSQTKSARLYEFTSKNGKVVSAGICDGGEQG